MEMVNLVIFSCFTVVLHVKDAKTPKIDDFAWRLPIELTHGFPKDATFLYSCIGPPCV